MELFPENGVNILHLNIDSLLPKIDEILFIAKQSNAWVIGISEFNLDSFILNSEVVVVSSGEISINLPRRGGGVFVHVFLLTLKAYL